MKILVDASRLTDNCPSGMQRYLASVIQHLAINDRKNSYEIVFRYPVSDSFWFTITQGNRNFVKKLLPGKLLWTQVRLFSYVRHQKPDVLFCPWHTVPGLLSGIKIVSVFHDIYFDSILKHIPSFYTAHHSDLLICVSDYTKSRIVTSYRVAEAKISVVYEAEFGYIKASPASIDSIKNKYGISSHYIFFVGTVVERKNVERMLLAFAEYKKNSDSGTTFVIGGNLRNYAATLVQLCDKMKITPYVRFLGYVPEEDLASLYSGALFLSYPSIEEGFGLPILEAQSCGTPVLTSYGSALQEVGGNSCYYVDPFSYKEIAEGYARLITDASLRDELISLGYANVKRFDWNKTALKLIEIFESLN